MNMQHKGQPISGKATWGYNTDDVYFKRWNLIIDHINQTDFSMIDWGSDFGWFSVNFGGCFPQAQIFSVEGDLMSQIVPTAHHQKYIDLYKIKNNQIIKTIFSSNTFKNIKGHAADYQLVLSIFHWMGEGYGKTFKNQKDWDEAFCDLVQCARVTFFEIPNASCEHETPHKVRAWYGKDDEMTAMKRALKEHGLEAEISCLGQVDHGRKGPRNFYKIHCKEAIKAQDPSEIAKIILASGKFSQPSLPRRIKSFVRKWINLVNSITRKN